MAATIGTALEDPKAGNIELRAINDRASREHYPSKDETAGNAKRMDYDDQTHMQRLGKTQEFDRNFRLLSITAFSVVAMGGWIFVPNNSLSGLVDGNTGGTIVMYLINFAAFSTIILSLAEMSSMLVLLDEALAKVDRQHRAPTAGGQYHWTYAS
ncbi:hypothetical protein LTR17_002292 [Elasticomyces elasticus]|nr:hypothetical protein LTR17_002292 [Elasticomyces elasticus]